MLKQIVLILILSVNSLSFANDVEDLDKEAVSTALSEIGIEHSEQLIVDYRIQSRTYTVAKKSLRLTKNVLLGVVDILSLGGNDSLEVFFFSKARYNDYRAFLNEGDDYCDFTVWRNEAFDRNQRNVYLDECSSEELEKSFKDTFYHSGVCIDTPIQFGDGNIYFKDSKFFSSLQCIGYKQ